LASAGTKEIKRTNECISYNIIFICKYMSYFTFCSFNFHQ